MLMAALRIVKKDLRLVLSGGRGLVQAVLLGLLLVFVFSLSVPTGEQVAPEGAAAVFWLASIFGLVLLVNTLYALEESGGARTALLLSPCPPQSVWLGKALASGILLLVSQAVFFPACIVFLGRDVLGDPVQGVLCLLLVDIGLVALGSLLGALAQGEAARESLLSVILFPLLVPVLLAGIRIFSALLGGDMFGADSGEAMKWLGLAAAFDAVFSGAALLLFPYIFSGEE